MNLIRLVALEVHEDPRGRLAELLRVAGDAPQRGRQIFLTTARFNQVKGNHYHTRKTEHFVVVSGRATMAFRDVRSDAREQIALDADRLQRVEIPPFVSHAIRNEGPGELVVIVWADELFDRDDPDTIADTILLPRASSGITPLPENRP